MIDAKLFTKLVGREPIEDDLERVNCPCRGTKGHWSCGWNMTTGEPTYFGRKPTDLIISGLDYLEQ